MAQTVLDSAKATLEEDNTAKRTDQSNLKAKWASLMGQAGQRVLHKKTSVLVLHWAKDCCDFDVSDEVTDLCGVLEDLYRFTVITRRLDVATRPQAQAFVHLSKFVHNEDTEDGLLIVYYAGHGGSEVSSLGRITLSGKDPNCPSAKKNSTIEWTDVERVLADTKSDVFEIFDCCHAGLLCSPAVRGHERCFEFLGACHANQPTPTVGPRTFTNAVIWALREFAGRGFWSNELLAKIQSAPNFPKTQSPQLYAARFESHGGYLYIAPTLREGPEAPGILRRQREEEEQQEEILELRFHFDGKITEDDLRATAAELRSAVAQRKIRARQVSLVGKYNIGRAPANGCVK